MFNIFASLNVFVYSSLVGSFLNVVIYRLPRHEDIVFKPSACPSCGHKIRWYELVPIFSFLFLKGRCANCKKRISFRYPVTELVTAMAGTYLSPINWELGNTIMFLFYFISFCIFLCHFQIDLDHKILPDSLNLILFSLFLSYSVIHYNWTFWLMGGLIGVLFPLSITWIFYLMRGQVGLGGGDIKLYGILGILMGTETILKNIFLSCFLGAIVGGVLILTKRMSKDNPIPFGPFIIVVAVIQIYFPWINQFLSF